MALDNAVFFIFECNPKCKNKCNLLSVGGFPVQKRKYKMQSDLDYTRADCQKDFINQNFEVLK